jgi:UDP-N-acetyl-D-mannosaminouronate:lipid I N-acetyl-D-mannosaminouronosyltransferase
MPALSYRPVNIKCNRIKQESSLLCRQQKTHTLPPTSINIKTATLNDKRTYAFSNKSQLLDHISNQHKALIAINSEKILNPHPELTNIINNNIGYCDGIGAVMAMRQKGFHVERIPGAELWLDIIKRFNATHKFYLLGSTQQVIKQTIDKLHTEFPHIKIVGHRDGYLKDDDKEKLKQELAEKNPDIVFIAQGSPRQELLIEELLTSHPALYMGLGGSFDVYSGSKKRAPSLFIKLNLEWLYRLIKEPTRFNRQLTLIKYMYLLITRRI